MHLTQRGTNQFWIADQKERSINKQNKIKIFSYVFRSNNKNVIINWHRIASTAHVLSNCGSDDYNLFRSFYNINLLLYFVSILYKFIVSTLYSIFTMQAQWERNPFLSLPTGKTTAGITILIKISSNYFHGHTCCDEKFGSRECFPLVCNWG